ncbi:hypothetical protein DKL61_03700 [Gammaproteobacteria bacterium ESL0073]|nr:hypothetical protein DKL61_03700 [Gammaproteobacteria bacterium ESL0073]
MISLWPQWQRPLFIILLPIIVYLLWKLWKLSAHKGSWQAIIPTLFQPWLLRGSKAKESIIPKLLITLASLFAILALLGPSWKHIKQPPLKLDAPLAIVVDMTPRMLSKDIAPSRLESVKRKLLDIISARKDAQTAIIAYAGSAHVVAPLSDDKETLDNLIKVLSPTIMPKSGENAEAGIAKAINLIDNTRQNNKTKKAEILLVTTGLNEQEKENIRKLLVGKSINLDILGVGTAQGAPILINGVFLKDSSGNIINPKLDSDSLQAFAYSEGGYYSTITLNNADIDALHLSNPTGDKRLVNEQDMRLTSFWEDQSYWLVLPILLIAAFAGRKGWLFCIPLLAFTFQPQTAHAFEWNQLWLNKDQQGQKLLKENKPKDAMTMFKDKRWQSYAAYEAKDYQKAEKAFANAKTPAGIYNYGNALARQGKYQEAIAAWDKAIKNKPDFEQAIVNKKIVEDLLKKQAQQQNSDQNNQQQDQNQQKKNAQENQQQNDGSSSQNNDQQNSDSKDAAQQNNSSQASNNNQQQNNGASPSNSQNNNENEQGKPKSSGGAGENSNVMPTKDPSSGELTEPTDQQQSNTSSPEQKQDSKEPQENSKGDTVSDSIPENQAIDDEFKRRLPESEDPSELLRRKFYFEQRYNKGDY